MTARKITHNSIEPKENENVYRYGFLIYSLIAINIGKSEFNVCFQLFWQSLFYGNVNVGALRIASSYLDKRL